MPATGPIAITIGHGYGYGYAPIGDARAGPRAMEPPMPGTRARTGERQA
ncbi:hypothetical protein [Streptomyces sp. NPDC005485]